MYVASRDRLQMKLSKTHASAVKNADGWICTLCDAESGDFEIFEEAGEWEDCLARGKAEGVVPNETDLVAWAQVQEARKWLDQAKSAATEAGEGFGAMNTALTELNRTMNAHRKEWERKSTIEWGELKTYDGKTVMRFENE